MVSSFREHQSIQANQPEWSKDGIKLCLLNQELRDSTWSSSTRSFSIRSIRFAPGCFDTLLGSSIAIRSTATGPLPISVDGRRAINRHCANSARRSCFEPRLRKPIDWRSSRASGTRGFGWVETRTRTRFTQEHRRESSRLSASVDLLPTAGSMRRPLRLSHRHRGTIEMMANSILDSYCRMIEDGLASNLLPEPRMLR